VWLLDPTVTHLNHGSYGACPRPVVEAWQEWQRELERSPTELLARRLGRLLDGVREALGELVGAHPAELALVRNATSGLNAAIRSLRLGPEHEVLTSTHEYGALVKTWHAAGARLVAVEPDTVAASIGSKTRVVFVSHITSDTARVMPVAEICAAARGAGALAIVDGAHAPGHVQVDLHALGADVYAGNCHKWLCAPKGSAFLWARPEHHRRLEPVVTSWGWAPDATLAAKHEWQGTFDPSAWLTIPTAIDVWRGFDLARCRALADQGRAVLPPAVGVPAPQMWASELPAGDAEALRQRLFDVHRIEVPVIERDGRRLLRVSVAPYTKEADLERLFTALRAEELL
jgi:isopenicillin-N epimerase